MIGKVGRIVTVAALCLSGAVLRSPAARSDEHTIMRLSPARKQEFAAAARRAPRAFINPSIKSKRGSASLLSHLEYTPAERNQGYCGNCWAWAGTGVLEIALSVQESIKDRLSVQYLNSCFGTDDSYACCGGWLEDLSNFYSRSGYEQAVPWSNASAFWQDGEEADAQCPGTSSVTCVSIIDSPNYPIDSIATTTITTQGVAQSTAISNIKNVIDQDKAVWFAFFMGQGEDWTDFYDFWDYQTEGGASFNFNSSCDKPWDDYNGGGHAVLCVGYNDDDPENSYWVMVNSWGTTAGRPNGIFRVDMDLDYSCKETTYDEYNLWWQTLNVAFAASPTPAFPSPTPTPAICTRLDEHFDGYNSGTRPAGWTFTNCNADTDSYTASGYYGHSSPSVKLDADGDVVTTTNFSGGDELRFWVRGVSTDASSSLLVEEYYSLSWSAIINLKPLPTTGTTEGPYALNGASTQLRFSYDRSAGSLALDDVQVSCAITPTPGAPAPTAAPETPTPVPATPTPVVKTPTPAPATPTPVVKTPTPQPVSPTCSVSVPTPTPPTPVPATTPTAAPETPTPYVGPTPIRRVYDAADFNGDGADDLGLWRASDSTFRVYNVSTVAYGMAGDIPITGDYNGDGTADYGVFRPSSGRWWVRGIYLNNLPLSQFYFGTNGDIPVPADYDGDFRTDTAIWRASGSGCLYAVKNQTRFYYGVAGDLPVPADYNGDGNADPAVFRRNGAMSGLWYIRNITARAWGYGSDAVAPGDFNGDGTAELSVFRGYAGSWYILGSPTVSFGQADDVPVVIDYEGDGTQDRVLYRPSTGAWYIYGVTTISFGTSADQPAVGKTE